MSIDMHVITNGLCLIFLRWLGYHDDGNLFFKIGQTVACFCGIRAAAQKQQQQQPQQQRQ